MKIATLALIATVAFPLAAYADSSQPNSAPGLEGQPVTSQGEGTTGMNNRVSTGTSSMGMSRATTGAGITDTVRTRRERAYDGSMFPNEPIDGRR